MSIFANPQLRPTFSGTVLKERQINEIMLLVVVAPTQLLTLVGTVALFIQQTVCFVHFHKNWY